MSKLNVIKQTQKHLADLFKPKRELTVWTLFNQNTRWFEFIDTGVERPRILFGHWAALMGHDRNNVIALDTGCVWGEYMTMNRVDDGKYFMQKAIKQ